MGFIKSGVKLGTALGVTYLSVEQRLWSQLSHNEIQHKLNGFKDCNRKAITFVTEKTGLQTNQIKQWVPSKESIDRQSIDAKKWWNQTMKTTFKTLSEIHLKDLMSKMQKLMNSYSK